MTDAMTAAADYLGVRRDMPKMQEKTWARPAVNLFGRRSTAVIDWLKSRGLTEQTIAAFRIAERTIDGAVYAVFPYLKPVDGGLELVNAKSRAIANKKDMRQAPGAQPCLFGWHLVPPRARSVLVCEGEIDAMTWHQIGCGVAALSVNAGAGNHQWIESDWEQLQAFDTIYLSYDGDEPGQKGAAEVAQRLGNDRCRIVRLPAKDANEFLADGGTPEQFAAALAQAKTVDPQELRSISDFRAEIRDLIHSSGAAATDPDLRFGLLRCDWLLFRPGETTIWTGYNGHGKSLVLNQVLLGLFEQGQRACIYSGEMAPAYQGRRIVRQAAGLERPAPDYLEVIFDWLADKAMLFDVQGPTTLERLLQVFGYAARRYGITHFVVDSLMMTDVPEDGPGAFTRQKDAMRLITGFAKSVGGHVHLVAHPRKGNEDGAPSKMDVAGSSKLTDAADNVITVWSARRDAAEPEADPDRPDGYVELQKQRNGETQRRKQWLWFEPRSQQYTPSSRRQTHAYVQMRNEPIVPEGF